MEKYSDSQCPVKSSTAESSCDLTTSSACCKSYCKTYYSTTLPTGIFTSTACYCCPAGVTNPNTGSANCLMIAR